VEVVAFNKGSSGSLQPGGIYVGKVVRVDDAYCYVELPRLSPGSIFGPCLTISTTYPSMPAIDDIVICSFLENNLDQVVVLGKTMTNADLINYDDIDGGTP
jgi:hypothetical protein